MCGEPHESAPETMLDAGSPAKISAALICGILSCIVGVAGIALGILAIVFGAGARKAVPQDGSKWIIANSAWILGIVGLCLQPFLILSH